MHCFTTLVDTLQKDLGIHLCLTATAQGVVVSSLIVPKARQRSGIGTLVMQRLCALADQDGVTLLLSPAQRDPHHGTTSRARLVRFYKRFGFVENKGRHKDFSLSHSMLRHPRKAPQ